MKNFLKGDKGYTLFELLFIVWIVLGIAGVVGYVKNIIHLADCDFQAPYKAEVIYGIGLIPPVGCVTGFINIPDGIQTNDRE